ncbi:MAG: hybrid sensor histidine kinase/response regulator [unclassified Hahellaceae]|nr:hybrid sensor histidine kinase/response regulator [Hahellaceae bacterium]|tara:strand:- start:58438 stop:60834 length:2397 start_codon:yes stop_codon:yes gene_type:complete
MMKLDDYRLLFDSTPYPYLVMDRDLTIIGANSAYLRSVGREAADIVGRYVFDAFPANPDDPDSTNIAEVKASLEVAIATGRPHTTPCLRYAVPTTATGGTTFSHRIWSAIHTPAVDANGKVLFVTQSAIDVTELYLGAKAEGQAAQPCPQRPVSEIEAFSRAQMHEALARILKDEHGHLRNLFSQAPGFVAVLTGPDHVFNMVNEAYYQLVGHREIIGKTLRQALPDVLGQGYEELLDQVYRTGEQWQGRGMKVLLQPHVDGPIVERFIDLSYQPYYADDGSIIGIFAQGYDVTEAFEAQAAKRESDERLKEGMVAAKMVVWDWDIATREMIFSDNVMEVLGRTADSLDALYTSIHEEDQAKMKLVHERAFAEKSSYREVIRFNRPDNGRQIWIDVRGMVRCDAAGRPQSVRGVTLDVTERVQAEEELREADRRKDEFLAMLAHELRNPLAPISSAAQLMKMVKLDEARLKQTSEIITRQIGHMTGLVDDLIDVSRVTRGLVTTAREPLDMKRIISDAVEQISPLIESKRHHLILDLPAKPARVLGDQKRLVQVITNILNNAAKYTPAGGNITLQMEVEAEHVAVSVKDDGIGISAELLPRIFELFSQAERTSDRSQGGLGVGLALVRSLVDLHGGQVLASSDGHGKGSRFVVCLPRLDTMKSDRPDGDASGIAITRELRVMVVDDNADAAEMLAMFLEASGHKVMTEHSARAVLDRLERQVPDVFLLDIGLPEMDGNELARQLRQRQDTRQAVLIAITGYGQAQDREKSAEAGFDHHFVKPVDTLELLQVLSAIEPT